MMSAKRIDVLGCKIGMIYHPNFEESLWNIAHISEDLLGYAKSTVRTNLVGVGRNQASKAWKGIHRKKEERGSAYYARPQDIVSFLEKTFDVGKGKPKERAEALLNDDFLVELRSAWSNRSQ